MTTQPSISFVVPSFNDQDGAAKVLDAFQKQEGGVPVEVVFIDDGSTPPLSLPSLEESAVRSRVIRLGSNCGRAGAINAGIAECGGQYIGFLDADCVPARDYVARLSRHIAAGSDVIFGHIVFRSSDPFFERYENIVQAARRSAQSQWPTRLTSANVCVRSDLVKAVGGFNPDYRHYGFEDRDFLIRLSNCFPSLLAVYCDECRVSHTDRPSLRQIVGKFRQSGRHTARLFAVAHPAEYAKMPVATFDASWNPMLRKMPRPLLSSAAAVGGWASQALFLAAKSAGLFSVSAASLKGVKAFAYLKGTLEAGHCDVE